MRLLICAALLLSLAPSAAAEPATPRGMHGLRIAPDAADCPPISRFHANRRGGKLAPQKLTELPPADAYRAVLLSNGRCQVPVIVKYDVSRR